MTHFPFHESICFLLFFFSAVTGKGHGMRQGHGRHEQLTRGSFPVSERVLSRRVLIFSPTAIDAVGEVESLVVGGLFSWIHIPHVEAHVIASIVPVRVCKTGIGAVIRNVSVSVLSYSAPLRVAGSLDLDLDLGLLPNG